MVGDLFSAFVLTRTISEDSFAKYPVSDPSQRLSQRTRLVPPKILVPRSWYQDLGTYHFREKVKPITTPPDKVFERPG